MNDWQLAVQEDAIMLFAMYLAFDCLSCFGPFFVFSSCFRCLFETFWNCFANLVLIYHGIETFSDSSGFPLRYSEMSKAFPWSKYQDKTGESHYKALHWGPTKRFGPVIVRRLAWTKYLRALNLSRHPRGTQVDLRVLERFIWILFLLNSLNCVSLCILHPKQKIRHLFLESVSRLYLLHLMSLLWSLKSLSIVPITNSDTAIALTHHILHKDSVSEAKAEVMTWCILNSFAAVLCAFCHLIWSPTISRCFCRFFRFEFLCLELSSLAMWDSIGVIGGVMHSWGLCSSRLALYEIPLVVT